MLAKVVAVLCYDRTAGHLALFSWWTGQAIPFKRGGGADSMPGSGILVGYTPRSCTSSIPAVEKLTRGDATPLQKAGPRNVRLDLAPGSTQRCMDKVP